MNVARARCHRCTPTKCFSLAPGYGLTTTYKVNARGCKNLYNDREVRMSGTESLISEAIPAQNLPNEVFLCGSRPRRKQCRANKITVDAARRRLSVRCRCTAARLVRQYGYNPLHHQLHRGKLNSTATLRFIVRKSTTTNEQPKQPLTKTVIGRRIEELYG